jgi:DNA-binding CsgD family transcriptional regulator
MTTDLSKRVLDLVAVGRTSTQIAEELGLTKGQVSGIRNRAKIAPKRWNLWTKEHIQTLRELRALGVSNRLIAERIGRSINAVEEKVRNLPDIAKRTPGDWHNRPWQQREAELRRQGIGPIEAPKPKLEPEQVDAIFASRLENARAALKKKLSPEHVARTCNLPLREAYRLKYEMRREAR